MDGNEPNDLEHAHARGGRGLHFVAFFLANESLPDGRRNRDEAAIGIGIFRHHQFVREFAAALANRQLGPKSGAIDGNPIEIHKVDLGHPFTQHRDAGLDEPLALLGRMVFGILAKVTQFARSLDFLGEVVRQLSLEHGDLIFESLDQPLFHDLRLRLAQSPPKLEWRLVPLASRISSRRHPIVQQCRRLSTGRDDSDAVLLDGEHLIAEALGARIPLRILLARDPSSPLAKQALAAGVEVHAVDADAMAAASPVRSTTGVVAIATWTPRPVAEAFTTRSGLIIALIDVQDPGNVGSVIRSADALGASAVIAAGTTADPAGWKALRGAMGSTFHLPVCRGASDDLVAVARKSGTTVMATTADEGEALDRTHLAGRTVVLLGNEGAGLPAAVLSRADRRLHIPMRPGVNSLNVAVAAALILYEANRARSADSR